MNFKAAYNIIIDIYNSDGDLLHSHLYEFTEVYMEQKRAMIAFESTFLELLQEKPFDKIKANDVISRSTYSRTSFYRLYSDIYDLSDCIVRKECELLTAPLAKHIEQSCISNERESTIDFYTRAFRHVFSNKNFYRLLIKDAYPNYSLDKYCEKVESLFKKNSESIIRRVCGNEFANLYYYITTHKLFAYIQYWDSVNYEISPEELAKHATLLSVSVSDASIKYIEMSGEKDARTLDE